MRVSSSLTEECCPRGTLMRRLLVLMTLLLIGVSHAPAQEPIETTIHGRFVIENADGTYTPSRVGIITFSRPMASQRIQISAGSQSVLGTFTMRISGNDADKYDLWEAYGWETEGYGFKVTRSRIQGFPLKVGQINNLGDIVLRRAPHMPLVMSIYNNRLYWMIDLGTSFSEGQMLTITTEVLAPGKMYKEEKASRVLNISYTPSARFFFGPPIPLWSMPDKSWVYLSVDVAKKGDDWGRINFPYHKRITYVAGSQHLKFSKAQIEQALFDEVAKGQLSSQER